MPDLKCGSRNLGDSKRLAGGLVEEDQWCNLQPVPAQSSLCKIETYRTLDSLETVPMAM